MAAKGVISAFLLLCWLIVVANQITGYSKTFDIDGKQVTIECEQLCSHVDNYGDNETLKILAAIGVKKLDAMPVGGVEDPEVVTLSADSASEGGAVNLVLTYKNGKLTQIANVDYRDIVYYSSDRGDDVLTYPARMEISKAKAEVERKQKIESEKKAQEDAKQAKKAKAAADKKAKEGAER